MREGESGAVAALYLRPPGSDQPLPTGKIDAIAGFGLDGDRHADPLSPRQALVATTVAYLRHSLDPETLRANILLDVDPAALQPGSMLAIGEHAVLWLSFNCEACGRLDAHKPGLSKTIGAQRGILARVWHGGEIKTGDAIRLMKPLLPPWPDDWRERVAAILMRVPDGMVVEYRQLARLAGVQASYCRVFPRIARELGASGKAVSLNSASPLPRWDGRELFEPRPIHNRAG